MCELLQDPGVLLLVRLPHLPLLGVESVERIQEFALDGVGVLFDQLAGVVQLLHHGLPRGGDQAALELVAAVDFEPLGGDGTQGDGVVAVAPHLRQDAPLHGVEEAQLGVLARKQRLVGALPLQVGRETHFAPGVGYIIAPSSRRGEHGQTIVGVSNHVYHRRTGHF
jgi:hypothetical protein